MGDLTTAIPDAAALLALEPEELGAKILFLARRRHGEKMFVPGNYASELLGQFGAAGGYPANRETEVQLAVIEAWAWLEAQGLVVPEPGMNGQNGWRRFSRRARRFENEEDFAGFTSAKMLAEVKFSIPSISERVWLAFVRGEFDVAVFQAMKQVEIAVRDASGATDDQIGVKLARFAFNPETGPLTDKTREIGERQARSDLFAGALGSYKNPQSHRNVALDDPAEAIEQIMLASHCKHPVNTAGDLTRSAWLWAVPCRLRVRPR
ncbi:MAG: TIGR02391 family protein [Rhodospirillales bacterium]|nr:TIGR02391 family protein [Rhodospirillales bacterium]